MTVLEAMNIGRAAMQKANFCFDMIIAHDSECKRPTPLEKCNMLHLNVPLNNSLHTVQTAITFQNDYCDIRTFPDPVLFSPNDQNKAIRIIELLNYINQYIKIGRFYYDTETADIVLWIRIPYWIFEKITETLSDSVITSYQYYEDIGEAIALCADGILDVDKAKKYIDDKWN